MLLIYSTRLIASIVAEGSITHALQQSTCMPQASCKSTKKGNMELHPDLSLVDCDMGIFVVVLKTVMTV